MKKLLFILCLILLGGITVKAQEVVRNGNTFTAVSKKAKETYEATPYTYVATDGTKYPIYISSKGKYFIFCKSKKTGKQYRRYLPCINKELSK